MKRRSIGIINAIIGSSSYGTNPLFALPLFAHGIGVNSVLFYRYCLATIIYGAYIRFVKHLSFKISFNQGIALFVLAILFSLSSLTLFTAFNYIPSGIACTILFVYPIMVAVISTVFFKEKITLITVSAIALTLSGIIFLNNNSEVSINLKGLIYVLVSALMYALYMVGIKNIKSIRHIKKPVLTFYVMFFGLSVYIYNLSFCTELQPLNSPLLWAFAFGLAIIPTIISLEATTIAIKLVGPTITAIFGALEPLTAITFGLIFFHEIFTPKIALGIILILTGVTLVVLKSEKKTTT